MLFANEDISLPEVRNFSKSLWKDKFIETPSVLSQITRVLDEGKFPHCSIITGQPGSGQLLVGLHIAQALLCLSDQKPCGVCLGCYKVSQMIHPDLSFTFPLIGTGELCTDHYTKFKKAVGDNPYLGVQQWINTFEGENKQLNINVQEVRSVIERLSFTPFEGKCNVLLLWLPEYLGKEANILLKLLEEPPGISYLILMTEDIQKLLPTVLSRTQSFRLGPISDEALTKHLSHKYGLEKSKCIEFIIASESNLSLCIQWAEDQNVHKIELIKGLFQKAYLSEPVGYLEWIEKIAILGREEQKQFFGFLTSVLSLCLRAKFNNLPKNQGIDLFDYVEKISARLSVQTIDYVSNMTDELIFGIQRNANIRILLLDYLIKLSGYLRGS